MFAYIRSAIRPSNHPSHSDPPAREPSPYRDHTAAQAGPPPDVIAPSPAPQIPVTIPSPTISPISPTLHSVRTRDSVTDFRSPSASPSLSVLRPKQSRNQGGSIHASPIGLSSPSLASGGYVPSTLSSSPSMTATIRPFSVSSPSPQPPPPQTPGVDFPVSHRIPSAGSASRFSIAASPSPGSILSSSPGPTAPTTGMSQHDSDIADRRNGFSKRLRIFDRLRMRKQSPHLGGNGSTTNFSTSSGSSSGLAGPESSSALGSFPPVLVSASSAQRSNSLDDDSDPRIFGPGVHDFSRPRPTPFRTPRSVNFDQPRQHFAPVVVSTAPSRASEYGFIGGRRAMLADPTSHKYLPTSTGQFSGPTDVQARRATLQFLEHSRQAAFPETIHETAALDVSPRPQISSPNSIQADEDGPDDDELTEEADLDPQSRTQSQSKSRSQRSRPGSNSTRSRPRSGAHSVPLSHSASKSSQFSFQLFNGSVQERILEERHRMKKAQEAPDEEDDEFWREDMSDYDDDDDYDGYDEEPIPMAGEDDYDCDYDDVADSTGSGAIPETTSAPSEPVGYQSAVSAVSIHDYGHGSRPSFPTSPVIGMLPSSRPHQSSPLASTAPLLASPDPAPTALYPVRSVSPAPSTNSHPRPPSSPSPVSSTSESDLPATAMSPPPPAAIAEPIVCLPESTLVPAVGKTPHSDGPSVSVGRDIEVDDDDLYFDDGLIGSILPEDPEPDESMLTMTEHPTFDESLLDSDNEDKFAGGKDLPPRRKPSSRPALLHSAARARSDNNEADVPGRPLPTPGTDNINHYHNMLASALIQAEQDGRFNRTDDDSRSGPPPLNPTSQPVADPTGMPVDSPSADPDQTVSTAETLTEIPDSDADDDDDDHALNDFDFDDGTYEDDDAIAAANAEALAHDDDGFYGLEFGFYSRSFGSATQAGPGGFFGPSGINIGHRSVREPNLTPITERSEHSARNSYISPAMTGSAFSGGSNYVRMRSLLPDIDSIVDTENSISADPDGARDWGCSAQPGPSSPCPIPAGPTNIGALLDVQSTSVSSHSSYSSSGSRPPSQDQRPTSHRHHPYPSSASIGALESLAEDKEVEDQPDPESKLEVRLGSDLNPEPGAGKQVVDTANLPSLRSPQSSASAPFLTPSASPDPVLTDDSHVPPDPKSDALLTPLDQPPVLTRDRDTSESEGLPAPDIPRRSSLRLSLRPRPASDIPGYKMSDILKLQSQAQGSPPETLAQHPSYTLRDPPESAPQSRTVSPRTMATSPINPTSFPVSNNPAATAASSGRPSCPPSSFSAKYSAGPPAAISPPTAPASQAPVQRANLTVGTAAAQSQFRPVSLPHVAMGFADFIRTSPIVSSFPSSVSSSAAQTPTKPTMGPSLQPNSAVQDLRTATTATMSASEFPHVDLGPVPSAPPVSYSYPGSSSSAAQIDADAAYVRRNHVHLPQLQMQSGQGLGHQPPLQVPIGPATPNTPRRQRISYHDRPFSSPASSATRPMSASSAVSGAPSPQHQLLPVPQVQLDHRRASLPGSTDEGPPKLQIPLPPPTFSATRKSASPTSPQSYGSRPPSSAHPSSTTPSSIRSPFTFGSPAGTPPTSGSNQRAPHQRHTPHKLSQISFPPSSPPPAYDVLESLLPADPDIVEGNSLPSSPLSSRPQPSQSGGLPPPSHTRGRSGTISIPPVESFIHTERQVFDFRNAVVDDQDDEDELPVYDDGLGDYENGRRHPSSELGPPTGDDHRNGRDGDDQANQLDKEIED